MAKVKKEYTSSEKRKSFKLFILIKLIYTFLIILLSKIDFLLSFLRYKKKQIIINNIKKNKKNFCIICLYDDIEERYDLQNLIKILRLQNNIIIVTNSKYYTNYKKYADCLIKINNIGRDWLCYKTGYDYLVDNEINFKNLTFMNDSVWYFTKYHHEINKSIYNNKSFLAIDAIYDLVPHCSGYFFSTNHNSLQLKNLFKYNMKYKQRINNIKLGEHRVFLNLCKTENLKIIQKNEFTKKSIPSNYLILMNLSQNLETLYIKADSMQRIIILGNVLSDVLKTNCSSKTEEVKVMKWLAQKSYNKESKITHKLDSFFTNKFTMKLKI